MKINRKIGPPIREIDHIPLPQIQYYMLDNGIGVYELSAGTQDVVKIEIVFRGGRLLEDVKLTSRATGYLLKEETQKTSAQDLAEKIDFYGASISTDYNMDLITVTALFLGKYQEEILPVISEILEYPTFSEDELTKYADRNINDLQVELTKSEVIAYREFTEKIFGNEHIYGYNSSPELYKKLEPIHCQQYYENYLGSDKCTIFISGKITEKIRKNINHYLGQSRKDTFSKRYQPSEVPVQRQIFRLKGKRDLQSSIMIGRRLFRKDHPDYAGLLVLNTILGGYFGSRLMKSVREEHGYTYNIGSMMDINRWDGCIYISTDVDQENADLALKEIYSQIDVLQQEVISPAELKMVKNYILGTILNMLDGPFRSSKWIKSLIMHDMTMVQGARIIEKIREISGPEIQHLAIKYLDKSTLTELVVE